MAVFTEVTPHDAQTLLNALDLGQLVTLRGIAGGIENTNYFLTSERDGVEQEWVLTLFERLTHAQLPFYLGLMHHLAANGIAVPDPVADARGNHLHTVCYKPAALVNKLHGSSQLAPEASHCAQMGQTLAHMHLAARDYAGTQPNLRGLNWWQSVIPEIVPHVSAAQSQLLTSELAHQCHVSESSAYAALPRGAVHADIFRDNVMFEGDQLTGVFDFYFAGVDTWLFDLAVCINDWCADLQTGVIVPERLRALMTAYEGVRALTGAERQLFNPMLRAAAMRFWTSRLWDYHLPRQASMLQPHDPQRFENVLRERIAHPIHLESLTPTP
jgi:homoserine kinase type II